VFHCTKGGLLIYDFASKQLSLEYFLCLTNSTKGENKSFPGPRQKDAFLFTLLCNSWETMTSAHKTPQTVTTAEKRRI